MMTEEEERAEESGRSYEVDRISQPAGRVVVPCQRPAPMH
jgi:hypothetical protein